MPYAMRKLPNSNKYRVYDPKSGRVYAKGTNKKNATKQMAILKFIKHYPKEVIYGGGMSESLINNYEPIHKRRMLNPHLSNTSQATTHYSFYEPQFSGGGVSMDDIVKAQRQAKKESQNAYQINRILHPTDTSSWAVNKINSARNDFQNNVMYRGRQLTPLQASRDQQQDTYNRKIQRQREQADYQAKATGDYEKPSDDPTMDTLGHIADIGSKIIPFIV